MCIMNVHNGHVDNLLVSNCQHTCIVTVECRFSNMYSGSVWEIPNWEFPGKFGF